MCSLTIIEIVWTLIHLTKYLLHIAYSVLSIDHRANFFSLLNSFFHGDRKIIDLDQPIILHSTIADRKAELWLSVQPIKVREQKHNTIELSHDDRDTEL